MAGKHSVDEILEFIQDMAYLPGSVIANVAKAEAASNGGLEDLKAAQHLLEKLISVKSRIAPTQQAYNTNPVSSTAETALIPSISEYHQAAYNTGGQQTVPRTQ